MKRDAIGTGIDKGFSKPPWRLNHHMDVDLKRCDPTQGLDDRHTIRQVRYELAVHDIQMECLDPSLFEPLDLSLQIGKIAQKQRG